MRTLIVYTSQTGFTKRYVQWLTEKVDTDILELKDAEKKENSFFDNYEAIVYAGWCMAGNVVKIKWFLDKAKGWMNKKLAVMAVGGMPNDNPDIIAAMHNVLTDEQKGYIKLFYCQGGLKYENMSFLSRFAMKVFVSSLKRSKDEKQREMATYIDHSYDSSDVKFVEPVVAYLQEGNPV